MFNNATDHVWHVWINQEAERRHQQEQANAIEKNAIDPHGRNLYGFKSAIGSILGIAHQFSKERTKSLPMVHQQCSHSEPEPIKDNHLVCALGQKPSECPILQRLRKTFEDERQREYYRERITDEHVDLVAAATCVWHMLMGQDGYVDWNEGAIQDSSDRMFWSRVYENLSQQDQQENDDKEKPMPENNVLKIDLDRLEEEWQNHSLLVKEYSDKLADYRMELDQAEEDLKVQTAEAELDIRMKGPAEYNLDKLTEGTITALLQIHPKLQEIRQRIIQKKHDVRIAEGFTNSLEHRKKGLENEVQLFIAGYWSTPRSPRADRETMEKTGRDRTFDRVKQTLNNKQKGKHRGK